MHVRRDSNARLTLDISEASPRILRIRSPPSAGVRGKEEEEGSIRNTRNTRNKVDFGRTESPLNSGVPLFRDSTRLNYDYEDCDEDEDMRYAQYTLAPHLLEPLFS